MLRRFLAWLRDKLPKPEPKRLPRIQYTDEHGRECCGRIIGVVGFYLDVRPISEAGMQARLIGDTDAVDPAVFWEQWRAWGGDVYLDDGQRWEPPEY